MTNPTDPINVDAYEAAGVADDADTLLGIPTFAGFKVHVADVPGDTVIVGDFSKFARAARKGRKVNPKAFVVIKDVAVPADGA